MANPWDDYYDDETDFDPEKLEASDEIDFEDLWDYADWDDGDLIEYEFHGTGDTGGES